MNNQTQCWICPYCFEDHSGRECNPKELRIEMDKDRSRLAEVEKELEQCRFDASIHVDAAKVLLANLEESQRENEALNEEINLSVELREKLADAYKELSGKEVHSSTCATSIAPARTPDRCDCNEEMNDAHESALAKLGNELFKTQEKLKLAVEVVWHARKILETASFEDQLALKWSLSNALIAHDAALGRKE